MAAAATVIEKRIGFLGSGQMAEALAKGLMNKGIVKASQIVCNDPMQVRRHRRLPQRGEIGGAAMPCLDGSFICSVS